MHNRIILVWFLEYWYIICWWPITKYPKNFPHLVVPNPPQRGATRSFEKLKTPAANPYRGPLIWPPCVPWFSIIMEVWPLCWNIKRQTYPTRIAGQGIILLAFLFFFFFFFFNLSTWETRGPIMLKLGHNNKSANAHFWLDQFGIKGHVAVTGVKKVIFTKMLFFSLG